MRPEAGAGSLLVAHRGALGDFALTWPTLRRLRRLFPRRRLVGVGRPGHLELARALGLLDAGLDAESSALMPFFRGEGLPPALADAGAALLWMEEDPALQASLRALPGPVVWHPPFPLASTAPADPAVEVTHVLEHHLEALAAFGIPGDAGAAPEVRATPRENDAVDAPFSLGVARDPASILLHPGSGSRAKNFEPSFTLELAAALKARRPEAKVTIVLGPVEEGEVAFYAKRFAVATPGSPLELARELASSSLFIGNDSGPAHVAALLGTPTLALYRRADPRVWGVRGPRARSIPAANEEQAWEGLREALQALDAPDSSRFETPAIS